MAATLVPGTARAVPKYNKQDVSVQAVQQTVTKPTQKKSEKRDRPTISAADVFKGMGSELKAVTDSQIKVLQRLIDSTDDDDAEKPDLLFRMAELYFDQEHYYDFRARDLDQKIFDAQQEGNSAGAQQLQRQQADFDQRSKAWLKAAVKEYLLVTNNPKFANYSRMDQVLYSLAFLLTEQKREDLARPIFKRLIKDYPGSQYIPDAYLAFGEYYFEDKQMENALRFYDKVLQFPKSRVYGYAHYKEGWVYLNLNDYKKALSTFVAVIKEASKSKEKNQVQLAKEAKKDSVRAYANIGTPDKAWPFFQNIGGSYAPTMLEQLAELYNTMGKFDDSIQVYRELIRLTPTSPKLCSWQTEILRNTLSKTGSRATPDAVKELQRLSAVWEKYQTMPNVKPQQLEECRDDTAGSLRELATTWHKEAQKTKDMATYESAQSLYKEYLKEFPKEKDAYVMTFYYGELLFRLGSLVPEDQGGLQKFCDAAPVYAKVVEMDTSDKAQFRNDAAYAAVISWKNCLQVDDSGQDSDAVRDKKGIAAADEGKKKEDKQPDLSPQPIPEKWQKMLSAFDTYVKFVPNAPELVKIKYRRARVYYEYNHFKEAAPLFEDIVKNHGKDELAIYAANLYFDCLNAAHDYDALEVAVKTYCPNPDLSKDPDFAKQCTVIQNGIARKRIEQWEKEGKYRLAAEQYIKLATEHPDDPKLAELYYNAGVDYERAKAIGLAISVRRTLIEKKPDDPLAKKSVFLLGRAYQDIAAYPQAATQYEEFAKKWPGEKEPTDASTALYTASFFRRGLGEIDKSIQDTNDFIHIYGTQSKYVDKSAGVFFGLWPIYEAQGKDKLEKHLREYLATWGKRGGIDREIIANVMLGELLWKESCPVEGVNGACVEVIRKRATRATEEESKKSKKGKKKGFVLPKQCGPATKTKVVLHDRKPSLAKEAQGYFVAALRLYANGAAVKKVPGDEEQKGIRTQQMLYRVAQARMMEGDEQYEKLLAIQMPKKLDFTKPDPYASKAKQAKAKRHLEESTKKFKSWFDGKSKQLVSTQKIYQDVIQMKQAHWAIAAAARIGQVFQDFSGQLYTAPIPTPPKAPAGVSQDEVNQTFVDAYCDQMADTAEPLEKKAIEGLDTCLKTSTRLSWFNEWSSLCEGELNQMKPREYPLATEIRVQPGYYDKRLDKALFITEIK